jgi:hypothetical protein
MPRRRVTGQLRENSTFLRVVFVIEETEGKVVNTD